MKAKPDDHDLRINFGGLFGNLEDKEWRILLMASDKHPEKEVPSLVCSPGHLAMIVLPDHETLAHVMQEDDLRAKLYMPGKPAVCLLTKEMLSSI